MSRMPNVEKESANTFIRKKKKIKGYSQQLG